MINALETTTTTFIRHQSFHHARQQTDGRNHRQNGSYQPASIRLLSHQLFTLRVIDAFHDSCTEQSRIFLFSVALSPYHRGCTGYSFCVIPQSSCILMASVTQHALSFYFRRLDAVEGKVQCCGSDLCFVSYSFPVSPSQTYRLPSWGLLSSSILSSVRL